MTRLPLCGTTIRVAGFGGLRLGEQNALRANDAFFDHGYVHINGSWITPRGQAGVKEVLGLPAGASLQQVLNAQEEEHQRRASLAARE